MCGECGGVVWWECGVWGEDVEGERDDGEGGDGVREMIVVG